MFRRIIFASAGAVALLGGALAADFTNRPPPPVYLPLEPPVQWTGFYLGGNAGGTWSNSNNINTVSSTLFANFNVPVGQNGGFIGGGQIGYNYQFNANWVAGIEADIQGVAGTNDSRNFASVVGVLGNTVILTAKESRTLDYLGTVRGRLGFLITPTLLAYGMGGVAYGGVKGQTSISDLLTFTTGSFDTTRAGWTAGGGIEWMFPPHWSIKVEYLYYNLGSVTWSDGVLLTPPTLNVVGSSTRFSGNIVRAGLNYHFHWLPAPIVAKY